LQLPSSIDALSKLSIASQELAPFQNG
jgi:hypothetical protein